MCVPTGLASSTLWSLKSITENEQPSFFSSKIILPRRGCSVGLGCQTENNGLTLKDHRIAHPRPVFMLSPSCRMPVPASLATASKSLQRAATQKLNTRKSLVAHFGVRKEKAFSMEMWSWSKLAHVTISRWELEQSTKGVLESISQLF